MFVDAEFFLLTNVLEGFEDGIRVFTRTWTSKIPRDLL
jgi:hypothetical protein